MKNFWNKLKALMVFRNRELDADIPTSKFNTAFLELGDIRNFWTYLNVFSKQLKIQNYQVTSKSCVTFCMLGTKFKIYSINNDKVMLDFDGKLHWSFRRWLILNDMKMVERINHTAIVDSFTPKMLEDFLNQPLLTK